MPMATQSLVVDIRAGMANLGRDIQQARNTFESGTKAMIGAVDRLDDSIERVERGVRDVGNEMTGLHGKAQALAGVVQAVAGATMVHQLIEAERQFGILSVQLEVATGSAQAGEIQFARLAQLSTQLPATLDEVSMAFVRLKNMGLDPGEKAIISYANTAAAMGKPLEQMIEAVSDAATGEFERLKEFGIKASQEGDKVSLTFQGVTTTIGNNAREIERYLQTIGENQFAGAATKRMETLDGAISNLGDSWGNLARTINQNGLADAMVSGAKTASSGMQLLAENIDAAKVAGTALGAIVLGRVIGPLLQSAAASRTGAVAALESSRAELAAAEAQLARARAAGVYTANSAAMAAAEARHTAAVEAHAIAQRNASIAMSVGAAAARGASAIYAGMGGPFGIFIAAASLVVAYWDDIAEAAGDAAALSENAAKRIQKALGSSGGAPMRVINDEIKNLQTQLGAIDNQLNSGKKTIHIGRDERPAQVALSSAERAALVQDREQLRGALLDAQKSKSDLEARQMQNTESWIAKWQGHETAAGGNGKDKTDKAAEAAAKRAAEERRRYLEDLGDTINQVAGISASYNNELARLNAMYEAGDLTVEQYRDAVENLIYTQTDLGKAVMQARAPQDAQYEAWKKYTEAVTTSRAELDREAAVIGLGAAQRERMAFSLEKEREGVMAGTAAHAELMAQYDANREASRSWEAGASEAFADYADAAGDAASQAKQVFSVMADGMTDTLTEFFMTGKLGWKDFANAVIEQIVRIQMQKAVAGLLTSALSYEGFNFESFGPSTIGTMHVGGVVGDPFKQTTAVDPAVFAGAPRYHVGGIAGLKPGEVPAVLMRGEEVLTADDPRHIANLGEVSPGANGASAPIVQVNVINQTNQAVTATKSEPRFDGRQWVQEIVLTELNRDGPLRRAIQGVK